MESQEAPVQVFRSVWLLREPRALSQLFVSLAFDDTGSAMIFPERLEFHGKKQRVVLSNILSVRPGRYGADLMNEWLRIQCANGTTTYLKEGSFVGWGALLGGNGRLLQALKHLINTSNLVTSSQDGDMQIAFTGEQRVPVAKEEVAVPAGVTIKVRRSKSIARSIEFKDRLSFKQGGEVTLKQVVELSVQRQFEQETGTTFSTNETVEYEVELDGSVATRYSLSWIEVWREGIARRIGQSHNGTGEIPVPFRVRERVELDVQAIK